MSYGGAAGNKLQNQLEQVLMMKSGEFSAHGGRLDQNQYLQNSNEMILGTLDHQNNSSGIQAMPNGQSNMVYGSNYGNPNFYPP